MARRSFGRLAPRRQGPRRATEWGASADSTAVKTLGGSGVVLDQSFTDAILSGAGLLPSTIVRVRGELWVHSDQGAANEAPFGAMAFAIANENARAAGIASLLTPIADEAADGFFVFQYFMGANNGASTGALFGQPWYRFEFDSRAMRKIEDGDSIAVVLENASPLHALEYILKFRILFKVH